MTVHDEGYYCCTSCGLEIAVQIDLSAGSEQKYVQNCPACNYAHVIHIEIETCGDVRVWATGESNRKVSHCEGGPMSIQHVKPGESIQLPLGANLQSSKTKTLVKTADLELIRLVLPAGKEIPTHKVPGEITVQCLEGRVAFTVEHVTQELTAGQLLYFAAGQPHSVKGIEDSSVLLTMLLPRNSTMPLKFDAAQEAGEESFPASESPSYSEIKRP